ncbi:MAG: ATP cone domain-containing protein [Candidatus Pacebacteria bacterium]|jgi:hypothetical protein|nr:ATPase [bacterium]MDP6527780.1 ATP cone domain-containing protein [Candidatus Paceibacterota bacterium]MDP6659617.1 ATP cone domain-containing protein [Candidatus Paceibacterota bacterium]|tara:strand:- start:43969 stop:44808 length:840 start_codon:yes stop_codon:yes gene_type:complete
MLITKANGEQEEFDDNKLKQSLKRSGAEKRVADYITEHVVSELKDGMSTEQIYSHAFDLLKKEEQDPAAARYSLKRAVLDLGPSGFSFEDFVSEIYREKGYKVMTGTMVDGKCASHEVDILAHSKDHTFAGEIKFHNKLGFKTGLRVALYVFARFDDLRNNRDNHEEDYKIDDGFLITNTKFTKNAEKYAKCVGLSLTGWNYPEKGGLQDLIEETSLHPITCLTSLSNEEKKKLLDNKLVLCRSIKGNHKVLLKHGISPDRAQNIIKEASVLCQPGTGV